MPIPDSKSALPELLVIDLLPCLATLTSQHDAINEAVVDILKVCIASPPVPQLSTISLLHMTFLDAFLIDSAKPDS